MEIHLIVVEIFHKCQPHSGAEGEVLGSPPVIRVTMPFLEPLGLVIKQNGLKTGVAFNLVETA